MPLLSLLTQPSISAQHHRQPGLASGLEAHLRTQEEAGQELAEQRAQPEASTSEAGPPGGSGQPPGGKQGPGGKRKGKDVTAADVVAKHKAKAAKDKQEGQQWFDLKQNTSVYVSNLPTDVTEAEIAEVSCLACALWACCCLRLYRASALMLGTL